MNWTQLLSSYRFTDKSSEITHDKNRSRFEQDYDRIIFSQPFRKLQDKTQVFPLPEDDFVHTRLTHSLEVSSVGRSLGKNAGLYLLKKYEELTDRFSAHDFGSIVASACLAHDLGNPPFGHAGEDGISSFFSETAQGLFFKERVTAKEWTDLTAFEGNAQGFRILNSPLYKGTEVTFATLGAFTKYPLASSSGKEKERKSQKKYGFYQSDRALFQRMASSMNLMPLGTDSWCRHPLTFLVEAADDICYSIIDLEDGCRLGLVPFGEVKNFLARIIGTNFSEKKLEKVPSLNEKLGILRSMAIHQMIRECSEVFKEQEAGMLSGTFDKALADCIPSSDVLAQILKISIRSIYQSKPVLEKEAGGHHIVPRLMETFCTASYYVLFGSPSPGHQSVFRLFPEEYQIQLKKEGVSVYEALQFVTDYISGLTDRYAVKLYRTIHGPELAAAWNSRY